MVPFRVAGERVYIVSSASASFFSYAYFLIIHYLPICFQVIDNVSAAMGGVRNLPLILAVTISKLTTGAHMPVTGVAAPVIVAGTAISLLCTGLLYTFDIDTSEEIWIGYQVVGSVGWGVASQIPIITVQATTPAADLAEATAILLFLLMACASLLILAKLIVCLAV